MSVLLRRPATVPALFSGAVEPDPPAGRAPAGWRRLAPVASFALTVAWAAVALIEVPLMTAAAAATHIGLPG